MGIFIYWVYNYSILKELTQSNLLNRSSLFPDTESIQKSVKATALAPALMAENLNASTSVAMYGKEDQC